VGRPDGILARGAVAAVVGATALALWFLVVDALEGRAFYTPSFLAYAVFGYETVEIAAGRIVLYTFVHYAAFLAVGIGVAALLRKLDTVPTFLLGAVLGFFLFNLVFYTSVIVTGIDVVAVLGWPEVLMGNLIAGITLMGYLHLTAPVRAVSWRETLRRHTIIREGLIAGLIGASIVAIWFFIIDLITAQALFTPAALGSAIFTGARDVADVQFALGTILGYTLIHGAAFIIVGIVAAAVLDQAEQSPPLLLGFALLSVTAFTLFIGLVAIIAQWILQALAWWSILLGTLLAAVGMGIYLWRAHPKLGEYVRHSRERPSELEEPV
jgi:hypothetical protein